MQPSVQNPTRPAASPAEAQALSTLGDLSTLSDAQPRDMSRQQSAQVRSLLLDDLFYFAWFIFGFRDLSPDLHGKLASLIGKWGEPGLRRLMIQVPRNFFKTSLCSIANSLWQICREPDEPVAIFNEKQDNAAQWVRTIRDTTQSSPLFLALWGQDLMPPGKAGPEDRRTTPRWWKWNDDEIMFQRSRVQPEASISALGLGTASAGRHWPKIILDDLISEDARDSPTIMAATKRWVDTATYLERPAMQGKVLVPCTAWAYDDTYAYMLRKYGYVIYRRSALENAEGEPDVLGESTFPSVFPTELLREQNEKDDFTFSAQMQNVPRPGRDRSFDPKWLRWGSIVGDPESQSFAIRTEDFDSTIAGEVGLNDPPMARVPLAMMNKALLWDPAPTEQNEVNRSRGSRNGLVVVGRDPWGRLFFLDCWAGRTDPLDVISAAFRLADRWSVQSIGVEEVAFSMLYRHWLTQEMKRRGQWIPIMRLKTGNRQKDARIVAMIAPARSGLFYLNRDTMAPLAKELVEFPYSSLRDLIDAAGYHDKVARPETWDEITQRLVADRIEAKGASAVTGY